MSEVLFLAHRVPFPPDRGDKIRSNHLLRRIAELAPVHVGCLADDDDDRAEEGALAQLAASHCIAPRPPLARAGLCALARRQPVSVAAFRSPHLRRWTARLLRERPISAIYVFSGQMADYVPAGFGGRFLMDFVDVDSAKFEAYARESGPARRWLYTREARLLRAHEERAARRASVSLLVTPEEKALFEQRLFGQGQAARGGIDVQALGNGIDAAAFDPIAVHPAAEMGQAGPQIVFTGQMDYQPNVEAVTVFAHQVMPRIRALFPEATFNVVGRAPTGAVRSLQGVHGTHVTGAVPDVRPWLAGADLVAAPLQIARGVQNKVLEAMAMARPVLLTPAAATGIAARDGEHFAVADGAHALGSRALALLSDLTGAQEMGQAARRFVLENCAWDRVLAPLPALLGLAR
ncbi:TIGR03087 family PEP-CTERM/XrtA system glycosyltransferase [Novosphingobium sp. KCTC 2891]|uniref:TIGR03087 family PEP-CTERM/XrtA system glycosyltransferase n=1 Tax=Novosphingobium sp. KCTC 2891 TaxID=2989730 RepID=UPI002222299D|nr:TIGR03087 family PEP-CTERM/XrtA system glycosyltransferase [Novosphingobium sp. KCTC 2891]MCW1381706.1 TIGR03087 family PEP-CTERM/XrtA system glycosyltransferase [Novosphingobium sp. KCTC 2891]